jgi:selenocysteine lyase/cysteine desulfurase
MQGSPDHSPDHSPGPAALPGPAAPPGSDATAERTRVLFARVVGAREGGEDSVAITPSTSYAISQAAANLEPLVRAAAAEAPAGGCDVLVLQDQMSSNVYAWQARRHTPAHIFLLHAGTGG